MDRMTFEEYAAARLPALLRYATVLTGDPQLAQDIVQDVLIKACLKWARVNAADRPDDYVRRMVVNEFLSWRRRWPVRSVRPSPDAVLDAGAPADRDHAEGIADADDVRQRLAGLPPRQRTVLVLRFYQGLDDAEIAAFLGVSTSTVRSTMSRGLAALRTRSVPDRAADQIDLPTVQGARR